MSNGHDIDIRRLLKQALSKDKIFFSLIASYALVIALVNLALPISIQMLINSVAYTALIQPIVIISIILAFMLGFSATLSLLQKQLLEIYKRKSFVRTSSELFIKSIHSENNAFRKRNTSDLSSRFFEIFNIQRSASELIIEGLLTVLQIAVSFILSSFYHPYLMVMNIISLIVIFITWKFFKSNAINTAIQRSEAKFEVFAWLDDVFRMNNYFKSKQNKEYALSKGHTLINHYIETRKSYWRISFTQLIILTVLYAVFAIALFGVGSFLVIKGQLSLGQLVASEIIFTGAMFGVAKLSNYFDLYYNLVASADELSHVFDLPNCEITVPLSSTNINYNVSNILTLENVNYTDSLNNHYIFDFKIKSQTTNLLISSSRDQAEILTQLISYLICPHSGIMKFFAQNYSDFDPQNLRNNIWSIENDDMFSCTIKEYLTHGFATISNTQIYNILELVELDKLISRFPNGIETLVINNGYPLNSEQIIQLKLARSIIHQPDLLIVNNVINKLPLELQNKILQYIKLHTKITLLTICDHSIISNEQIYDNITRLALVN